jgi:hypothetical protein
VTWVTIPESHCQPGKKAVAWAWVGNLYSQQRNQPLTVIFMPEERILRQQPH